MSLSHLPIVYITGATATGKGTLGKRLAVDFGFYHISLGDLRRGYSRSLRSGLPWMSDAIRKCVTEGTAIPQSLLNEYDTVPAILQHHNLFVGGCKTWSIELASTMMSEQLAQAQAFEEEGGEYTGVIIDGHPLTSGMVSPLTIDAYEQAFSGLTIVIESPREIAQQRYLDRARSVIEDSARFEARMKLTDRFLPAFIEWMEGNGEVVYSTNDGTMSIDDAYNALVAELDRNSKVWHALKERSQAIAQTTQANDIP
ncbi:P-loop containing nucleoside triphosphate hydrolase protein [Nemania serpens]|nr:P-loop containing nucleoside triphosphate hydrolase protein [Nemania serpens]